MSELNQKEIKKAIEGVNTAFSAFKKENDKRLKQIETKGHADPLLEEKIDKLNNEIGKHQARLDEHELTNKRQTRIRTDKDGNEIDEDAKALHWARGIARKRGLDMPKYTSVDLDAYKSAFANYLCKGKSGLNPEETKSLSVGIDADGGYTVHPDLSGRIVSKIFETSPMRAYASIQTIGTNALEGLYDQGEVGSGWVGETNKRPETQTPQFETWSIPVREIYGNPAATQQILDDSEINIEQWVAAKTVDRFLRKENTAFVAGTVANKQPVGFLTYPDGEGIGKIKQFATGAAGDFVNTDVLIDALYSLESRYQANATWFMNRKTFAAIRKLKDKNDRLIWQPGMTAGQPATIFGVGYASFEDMPDIAADSLSIAVGDMRQAYQIVDRVGIRTLRNPYTNPPYIYFYSTKRVGGDVIDFDALRLISFKA